MRYIVCMFFVLSIANLNMRSVETSSINKWIVITTINYPTKAIQKLALMKDWHIVIVGDKKTPKDWHLEGCDFLSVEEQEQLNCKRGTKVKIVNFKSAKFKW